MEGFFMPIEWVTPEEFEKLTGGYRGSVYISFPAKRPPKKWCYLCPKCYEICTERPGIIRCDPCGKEWPR
jgi:hypothetical protein